MAIGPEERARLTEAWRASKTFRYAPEAVFDELAELAADSLGASFAWIGFVEADSVWSKGSTHPAVREMPLRDVSPVLHVLRTGEPLVVPDARLDPRFRTDPLMAGEAGLRFWAGVPVLDFMGATLGALFVADRGPRHDVPRSSLASLTRFADIASELFASRIAVHAGRRQDEKLERLAEFRRSVMSLVEESLTARRQDEFFHRVLERAVAVIPGAEAGSVLLRATDGMFDFVAAVGFDLGELGKIRLSAAEVAFGRLHPAQPATVTEFFDGPPPSPDHREVLESAGRILDIQVSLSIPVVLDGVITAHVSLNNFRSKDAFGEEATEMGRIFAGYVASLVQRFQLEQRLQRLAYQDVLTELPNRASLDDRILEAFTRADQSGGAAAILFVDLDGFKAVNDTRGHHVGDEILRVVGKRLARSIRSGEAVGRFGGDEFVVVLQGDDVERESRVVAERILDALAQPIATSDGTMSVTGSVGIAIYPNDGVTAEEVLQNADKAMYRAKEEGKNTYSFSGGTAGSERDAPF